MNFANINAALDLLLSLGRAYVEVVGVIAGTIGRARKEGRDISDDELAALQTIRKDKLQALKDFAEQ